MKLAEEWYETSKKLASALKNIPDMMNLVEKADKETALKLFRFIQLDAAKAGMRLAKQKLRDYLPEAPTEVQDDILSHWEQHLDQLINTLTLEQLEKV